jgi:hypothetical protein
MTFDPRIMSQPVYKALSRLRSENNTNESRLKEQKNQAVELYTYLATWGMMRLKAEEKALGKEGKKEVVTKYFECLQNISEIAGLSGDTGLQTLTRMDSDEYLGLTGLGLMLAQEFGFWAMAIYHDIKGTD